jgi:hypothetical protein
MQHLTTKINFVSADIFEFAYSYTEASYAFSVCLRRAVRERRERHFEFRLVVLAS